MRTGLVVTCSILLSVLFVLPSVSFVVPPNRIATRLKQKTLQNRIFHPTFQLNASEEDEQQEDSIADGGNFDGKGFAGYLAPYAAALLVSLGVTAAFLKFVLLDY